MIRHEQILSPDTQRAARLPQPVPRIGQVNDPLEREADRAAASIIANENVTPISKNNAPAVSRKAAAAGPVGQRGVAAATHAVSQGGVPLTPEQRAYFEPRFGHDFSDVRLHAGAEATQAARGIGARAYTHGRDIAFARDKVDTRLLAHELTHVVQQRGGDGSRPPSGDLHEVEANQSANAIMAGRGVSPIARRAAVGVARQPALNTEESDQETARRRALSSLDWLEAYPPIVFDDNAPVLIAWADSQAEKYFDPDASDEKRAAIAAGLMKVYDSLGQFEGRAKRAPDGALLYTDMLKESDTPWSLDRPHGLEDVWPFTPGNLALWARISRPAKKVAHGRKSAKTRAPQKKHRAVPEPSQPSSSTVNVTFAKQRGMTLATPEGQRLIIAFLIASTRRGYTGDQIDYIVSRLNLEKRWMPPAGMDLQTWQQSFEGIPEGGEVTLTVSKSFTLELDSLLTSVPSDRDFMLEGFRQGVLDAEAGLKLGIATFAVGTAALGGGALLGAALAPAGAIGSGGLLGGGIGMSARTVGTHLYLNAPSLYGQAMLYSGAVLSGASLGQHLLDVRSRGVGWHDIPRLAEDLMPFAGGYQDYLTFSGGGGAPRSNKSPNDSPDTEIGPPRAPVDTAEPDLVITRPPRLDSGSGKVKSSLVDLRSKRAFDAEVDPETGNGQIVDRRTSEVVGVIANGEIRKPSTALPPSGATGAPPATPPATTPVTPPAATRPTTPIPSGQTDIAAPASPTTAVSKPPTNWRDFQQMASWVQALSRQKHGVPPNMVGMATPRRPPFTFASNQAWIWHGLPIRVVNTPTGPRAFYRRDGGGGIRPYGAQVGDWAPFLGFQPTVGGAHLVKPPSAVSPNTPSELYRWGNQEAYDANLWLQQQPDAPAVDVGEDWGIIQRWLEALGVYTEYPIGNAADVD